MRAISRPKKKGGDPIRRNNGSRPRRGRPDRVDRGSIVRNNGFTARQWEWLQREATAKNVEAMKLVREIVQWWIDNVEASRAGSVATLEDDQVFEKLVNKQEEVSVTSNQNIRSKK